MHAGGDLINFVKQYNESGLKDKGIELAVGLMFITDIHSLGVDPFAGTHFTDAWYWNFDEQQQRLGRPVHGQDRRPGRRSPTPATTPPRCSTWRPSRRPAPTTPTTIVKELEGKKVNDLFLRNGEVRAEDHRVIHDVYLARSRRRTEVKEAWDYEEIIKHDPGRAGVRRRPRPAPRCRLSLSDGHPFCSTPFRAWRPAASTRWPPSAWRSSSACSAW